MTLTGILTDGLASAYDEINHIFLDFWILISIFAEVINKFLTANYCFLKKLVYICRSISFFTIQIPILKIEHTSTKTQAQYNFRKTIPSKL